MALMQITLIPLGTGSPSIGNYIADVLHLVEESGLDYQLNDMGTEIYGSAQQLFDIAAKLHAYPFSQGVQRLVTHLTIDDRRDIDRKIGEKRDTVLQRISRNGDNG